MNFEQLLIYIVTSEYFWMAVAVGLLAQAIDGALGMAYGVTSNSFLLGIGASPAASSAAVHMAEIFTTASSGLSHLKFGNVDMALLKRIVIPGVIGGVLGVVFLTSIDGKLLRPFVTVYLLVMGLLILSRAFFIMKEKQSSEMKHVKKLAVSGGFLDAVGGGGWGPIVTSSLIGQGNNPRKTIGTVNTAEFFVALTTGMAFLVLGGVDHWTLVAGLIVGGLFAAPFAAYLTSKLSVKQLLISVGLLITGLSFYNLYKLL
jgi:uncharacterized membrane protein YfcA